MKRVLVVDDSSTVRRIIRQTLERRFGWLVVEADNVGAALDALHAQGPFDLIITDLNMPGLRGGSIIWRLRNFEETREVPILVVSVEGASPLAVDEVMALGASAFLSKPFPLEELAAKVAELLPPGESVWEHGASPGLAAT